MTYLTDMALLKKTGYHPDSFVPFQNDGGLSLASDRFLIIMFLCFFWQMSDQRNDSSGVWQDFSPTPLLQRGQFVKPLIVTTDSVQNLTILP